MSIKYLLVSSALLLINGNFGVTSEPNIKSSQTDTLQQNHGSNHDKNCIIIDIAGIMRESLLQRGNVFDTSGIRSQLDRNCDTSDTSTKDDTVVNKDNINETNQ